MLESFKKMSFAKKMLCVFGVLFSISTTTAISMAIAGFSPLMVFKKSLEDQAAEGKRLFVQYAKCRGTPFNEKTDGSPAEWKSVSDCVMKFIDEQNHESNIAYLIGFMSINGGQCSAISAGDKEQLAILDAMADKLNRMENKTRDSRSSLAVADKALSCGGWMPQSVCTLASPIEQALVYYMKEKALRPSEDAIRVHLDSKIAKTADPELSCSIMQKQREFIENGGKGDFPKDTFEK